MRWSIPQSSRLLYAAVFLAALGTRLYRLGWHLLWVDEIYSLNVSRMSPGNILRNSYYEPHSPLYYLLLKAATLSGRFTSEAAVRLLSALAGAAVIALLFLLAVRLVGRPAALAGAGFTLLSPTLMFYSQEARSYILGILSAAVSTLFVLALSDTRTTRNKTWAAWAAAGAIGMYAVYGYLFILAVQVAYLFWLYRFKRPLWVSLFAQGLLVLPILVWLAPQFAARLDDTYLQGLTLQETLQALVSADPARYGAFWGTGVLLWLFCGAGLLSLVRLWKGSLPFGWYLLAQIMLPLLGFFGIGTGLLGLHLPNFQSRQFLVLFPAVFLWALYGLDWAYRSLPRAWGAAFLLAISLAFGASGWFGLQQYWRHTKSPESRTVVLLSGRLENGDAIVSLHHSTSYALGRYHPDWPDVYAFPQEIDGAWYFDHNRFFLGANFDPDPLYDLGDIRAHARIWVLHHSAGSTRLLESVSEGCRSEPQFGASPFQITLVTGCLPR